MNMKYLGAALAGGLLLASCATVPGSQGVQAPTGANAKQTAAERAAARFGLLGGEVVCPTPPPSECCVAITGTSNLTVGGDSFNFEINTAANGPNGIGRVAFENTGGDDDDDQGMFAIVTTACIIENGALVGATADADVDGDGDADVRFTLRGTPPGGSDAKLSVRTLSAEALNDTDLPFPVFASIEVAQRSNQNVFPDTNCDGIPDPGLEAIPMMLLD